LLGVGFVEESAKLIIPLVIFSTGRFRHEADGLLFGIATGMGFATLESMGYGFTSYVNSLNSTASLDQTLLVRGILSPSGHAAWTGILCAVIWAQREKHGHAVLTMPIVGTFILVVILHSSWDYFGTISSDFPSVAFLDYAGLVIVGIISFWLLMRRFFKAHHTSSAEPYRLLKAS
jgi:RsiW-degrading membrane proteinase PrsW (M82 family)